MYHCILVKFKKNFCLKDNMDDIKSIFDSLNFDGLNKIDYFFNCINRENRFDLLIRINMKKESLDSYDQSFSHKLWKEKYSQYIDKKAIFDYEQ